MCSAIKMESDTLLPRKAFIHDESDGEMCDLQNKDKDKGTNDNSKTESEGFLWSSYLESSDLEAADSSAFKHVQTDLPSYFVGMAVEVLGEDGDTVWPAHVTMVCDSLLRLRYMGAGASGELWCDAASGGRLRPLGWSWQQSVPLRAPAGLLPPGLSAEELSRLVPPAAQRAPPPARTAGVDVERICEGMKLEVLDESEPYHVWTATVLERCGVRLCLRRDTLDDTPDLWLCAGSPRVRHFGWAARAGAPFQYRPPSACAADRTEAEWAAIREMSRDEALHMAVDDSILPYTEFKYPPKHSLSVGCRLEAVHPDLSAICPASVVAVLDCYFFRVQIDDSDISWVTSLDDPTILPYGWCRQHGLDCSGDDFLPSRAASPGSESADVPAAALDSADLRPDGCEPAEAVSDSDVPARPVESQDTDGLSQQPAEESDSQDIALVPMDSEQTELLDSQQPDPPDSEETDPPDSQQKERLKTDLSGSQDNAKVPLDNQQIDPAIGQRTDDAPDSQRMEPAHAPLYSQETGPTDSQQIDPPETDPPNSQQGDPLDSQQSDSLDSQLIDDTLDNEQTDLPGSQGTDLSDSQKTRDPPTSQPMDFVPAPLLDSQQIADLPETPRSEDVPDRQPMELTDVLLDSQNIDLPASQQTDLPESQQTDLPDSQPTDLLENHQTEDASDMPPTEVVAGSAADLELSASQQTSDIPSSPASVRMPIGQPTPQPQDVQTIDGEAMDGEVVDSQALEGQTMDSGAVDNEAIDGEAMCDQAMDGQGIDDETIDDGAMEGEANDESMDSFPATPVMSPLTDDDSRQTGVLPAGSDADPVSDSQQTVILSDSQQTNGSRPAERPSSSDSAAGVWLVADEPWEADGTSEPWLHLSPVSEGEALELSPTEERLSPVLEEGALELGSPPEERSPPSADQRLEPPASTTPPRSPPAGEPLELEVEVLESPASPTPPLPAGDELHLSLGCDLSPSASDAQSDGQSEVADDFPEEELTRPEPSATEASPQATNRPAQASETAQSPVITKSLSPGPEPPSAEDTPASSIDSAALSETAIRPPPPVEIANTDSGGAAAAGDGAPPAEQSPPDRDTCGALSSPCTADSPVAPETGPVESLAGLAPSLDCDEALPASPVASPVGTAGSPVCAVAGSVSGGPEEKEKENKKEEDVVKVKEELEDEVNEEEKEKRKVVNEKEGDGEAIEKKVKQEVEDEEVKEKVKKEPEEDYDGPRLLSSDLTPRESAEEAGLSAGAALELVDPEAPGRLCAAAVQRTAGHLVWLKLLSTAGAPDLIYPHTSDCLFPPGWSATNGGNLRPPLHWRRRRGRPHRQRRRRCSSDGAGPWSPDSAAVAEDEEEGGLADSEPESVEPPPAGSEASTWTGPLHVNTACYTGPLLSTNKLIAQPRVLSAGPVRLVARDLITRLVWAGYHESRILKLLQSSGPARPGWTTDLIKAKVNNTIYGGVVELPLSRDQLGEFFASVFGRLQCCPALVADTRYPADACPHRCRTTLRPAQQTSRSVEVASTEAGPALLKERLGPAKRPRPDYLHALEPPTRRRRARPPKWLSEEGSEGAAAGRRPSETAEAEEGRSTPPPEPGRPALYQVALEKSPRLWEAADLAKYLSTTECAHLVPSLMQQELDGVSFMLLTWSALTDVLHLSERDAVALCTHVSRVKYTYFTAFCN